MKNNLRQILLTVIVVVIVFGLVHFTLQSYEVDGPSMEDSFYNGQRILVEKLTYRFYSPHRGDVIVFWPPESVSTSAPYIKRVIGVPGDTIEIREGNIYINGFLLEENTAFGSQIPYSYTYSITIPEDSDQYFVLGDNRNNSKDSRIFDLVPRENIIGKVWLRYWPLGDLGFSPSYSYTYAE